MKPGLSLRNIVVKIQYFYEIGSSAIYVGGDSMEIKPLQGITAWTGKERTAGNPASQKKFSSMLRQLETWGVIT